MESTHKFGMESTHKFGMESTHDLITSSRCSFGSKPFSRPLAKVIMSGRKRTVVATRFASRYYKNVFYVMQEV